MEFKKYLAEQEDKHLGEGKKRKRTEQKRVKATEERKEERVNKRRKFDTEMEKKRIELEATLKKEQETKIATQLATFANEARESQRESEQRIVAQATARNIELGARIKRAADVTRNMLQAIPSDAMKVLAFFESFERTMALYQIQDDLWIAMMTPLLNEKSRLILCTLPPREISTFALLRAALLRDFQLTPLKYLNRYTRR